LDCPKVPGFRAKPVIRRNPPKQPKRPRPDWLIGP
jgi:hypothetical protein